MMLKKATKMLGSRKSESSVSRKSSRAGMNNEELLHETEELRARLEEAEATIQAIQTGEVDALIVSGPGGDKVFALEGADYAYRVIVEAMSEGVVTLSTDGGILSCNSRFAHFVKVPIEQIPGKPLASFAAEGEAPKLGAFLKKAAETNCATTITLARADGTTMPANLSAGAFEVGGFPALCVVIMDLTEMYVATETRMLLASIVETSY
ncbi:MAG: PAS domain-containing protein, partial [Proteobacteria bacterium]|nr:PAS domain-containing protein [Pseudomonadota bacterium]